MKAEWQRWLDRDPDPVSRGELSALIDAGEQGELERRFSQRLQFGTAGLRGVVGAGPARMNRLVVRETSAGLGRYALALSATAGARGIVIGFDGRLDSRQFAHDAACVFAALGFRVLLTADPAPTPLVAFATLRYEVALGVVVTASHNPPQYNGYKVFWDNGAQIIPPHDRGIAAAIEVAAREDLPWCEFDRAVATGAIELLDESLDQAYRDAILSDAIFVNGAIETEIGIAYTAMHGVGAKLAEALLADAGFGSVHSVAEQREPDGRFPTVSFPNPEEPGAMDRVIALAQETGASLACANDPDADRLAVAARTAAGEYRMLTGDMVGVLLANYLLEKAASTTPLVGTTIVSSGMLRELAAVAGAQYFETLTGFKWLANTALTLEEGEHRLLFAYEEALGYCVGRQVLDKDGLSALLAFVLMAGELAKSGMTVWDQLERLYRRHGVFLTSQCSIELVPGAASVGDLLREQAPAVIAGYRVVAIDDLSRGLRQRIDGDNEALELPLSDVLIYRLEKNARVIVRPSGTEPKVKCYYEVREEVSAEEDFSRALARAELALQSLSHRYLEFSARDCAVYGIFRLRS
jgi:phosphomannomutase